MAGVGVREVRIATSEDTAEIVRVINLAYRVEDFFVNGNRTDAAEVTARMSDPDGVILVVDGEGQKSLVAAVVVDVRDRRGHFAMLSVDPSHQGKGLARLLISAVENHCRAAACHSLDIEVVNLREELPPFYEAFGFLPSGVAPFNNPAKLTREAHLVRMTKSLLID
jgi:GNAT superfamily N-acetyltransferase